MFQGNSLALNKIQVLHFLSKNDMINLLITANKVPGWRLRDLALISSESEEIQDYFSAIHYLKISEQRWFSSEQRWKW